MAKSSKKNEFKLFIPSGRKLLRSTARRLSSHSIIPGFIRKQLKRTSNQPPKILNNRRQRITPELQTYIQKIDANKVRKKERSAIRELAHYAYVFDIEFYKNQLSKEDSEKIKNIGDCLQHYCIEGWKIGIDPSPLFDTNNYFSKYPDIKESGLNPIIHFFKFGIQEGRFSMDDIHFMRKTANIKKVSSPHPQKLTQAIEQKKFGVFLHIFYPELAKTIADYLAKIPVKIDIYISTTEKEVDELAKTFRRLDNSEHVQVKSFSNTGRDVAPFVVGFREEILKYDFILKLHSKKSPHSDALSGWFEHCLDNLIGSKDVFYTNIFELMNNETAIIYPVENYALSLGIKHDSCWGHEDGNYDKAKPLLDKLNLKHIDRDSKFLFPTGTMFWCKSYILQPILDWNLGFHDFDNEGGQIDGTLAHSIERLIGLCCTEKFHKRIITSYCGYANSKQHQSDKQVIEGRNKLQINGFEKVIQFKEKRLDPNWKNRPNMSPNKLRIHWVIPNFTPGLGGHMTIFRTINYLENCGHDCTIWVHSELKGEKPSRISSLHKRIINQYFIKLKTDQVYMLGNTNEDLERVSGDVVIATDRMSAYPVLGMRKFTKRFYFVQDYEPFFFAKGTSTVLTEQTYSAKHEFACICASPWLKNMMIEQGNPAISFPLAVDTSTYYQSKEIKRSKNTIAFYVRRSTPRRLYQLGLLALRALFDLGDSFEIITFGEDDLPDLGIPVKITHAGILNAESLSTLYQSCTVGLVLSGTNYSLVPNEMMACGLPVVDIDATHTRLSYTPQTAVLAQPNPDALALSLSQLLNDDLLREQVTAAGLSATKFLTWDQSNTIVEDYIRTQFEAAAASNQWQTSRHSKPLVTIVIPVYNGGDLLSRVVERCLQQDLDAEFEILIIDSSSSDGCINHLPKDDRIRIHRISKSEFGHGRTRNLGVNLARGEFVAFITQDAMPANQMWLMNLIAPLQADGKVAGVFGCHIAHEGHSPLTTYDLDQHFNRWIFRSHRKPIELDESRQIPDAQISNHERFYSDNNSCLRKTVWEQVPIPEVVYGEDQLWAIEILRHGFKKAYASTAVVRHSHEYNFRETLIRSNTEWHFYKQHLKERLPSSKKEVRAMIETSCVNDEKAQKLFPEITVDQLSARRKLHFARACGYYLAGKGIGCIRP
ncbi:Lipopolysaccharide biosynthesis protein-like [Synechococcus sp. BL107]|uniref:rhamnosyltransferase WsaF family glycosyltransferase n=1 Tax=Synechococcus sp. BL107 TaxID=313625 RepID=UPI0000E54253|nr:rhamnan synthesis F family protein [Synechococcus sp. BL107]EAU72305.1 Lipopolysaccharide biosynthesis protein-like [Synechococcus sp. BL107]